ncbi:hypothetical protein BWQ96_05880 [Gracilariopsis chorda]|uniref:DUF659 domain-containing protein n=1 Tax=Gracilariopsis chorda TaxID=448386 RepID=A0A2V3ITC0_9FLOR|nr:hypothetical protein BWQ96_05880 [Gracilariopsis chorda]|eukprot:PXF44360.1 hypothetical protein BWQ96_05880 [Gracilariopsis chorda]
MRSRVLESIAGLLSEGYATLVFDGWTDTCGASVVNVLLSLTGTQKVRRTFFLRSIYTGSKSCDAALYAGLCQEAIAEYGDIQRVCAVVGDNTSSCIKAKELLFQKYTHLVSVQDQPHMANLLMQDIGDISWVKEVLSIVSTVIADLRNHPKLYSRFKDLKTAFNLKCSAQSSLGTDCYGRVQLPKTAILPCRLVATRFASSESMAASFLRRKEVLLSLVDCPDFNARLYGSRNREKRDLFKQNVRNDSLYQKLLDIYHILRLIRQYLRLFDDESSLLSEVYPATMQLFTKIKSLPLTSFYTAERRADVIRVFEERLNGANRKVAVLTPLHSVSYLLDIRSMMENLNAYRPHVITHILSFVRSDLFPVNEKLSSDGGEDAAVQRLCDEFLEVRQSWRSQLSDPVLRHSLMMYSRSPVYH